VNHTNITYGQLLAVAERLRFRHPVDKSWHELSSDDRLFWINEASSLLRAGGIEVLT
jgi:hypothetical protein